MQEEKLTLLMLLHVQMKVTGNNLQNACKLVFTLSKDEQNDPHFAKEGIVGEGTTSVCIQYMYKHSVCVDAL